MMIKVPATPPGYGHRATDLGSINVNVTHVLDGPPWRVAEVWPGLRAGPEWMSPSRGICGQLFVSRVDSLIARYREHWLSFIAAEKQELVLFARPRSPTQAVYQKFKKSSVVAFLDLKKVQVRVFSVHLGEYKRRIPSIRRSMPKNSSVQIWSTRCLATIEVLATTGGFAPVLIQALRMPKVFDAWPPLESI
jgi:hypothetical protein